MNVFFKKQFKKIQQERARVRLGWDKKEFSFKSVLNYRGRQLKFVNFWLLK